ncbi:hypothetical protein FQA47_022035 [Oryzias melastigma]|uniref:Uncharacterized protein n=1 Tax=Oryzias melastigma TaxID=30732 RepID=A0A834L1S3_ORYME|nr:hypothetical protein FQA47_022035 [Oryzias melastigma]
MSRLYGVNFTLTARSSLASTMRTPRRSRASFTLSTTCSSVHSMFSQLQPDIRPLRHFLSHPEPGRASLLIELKSFRIEGLLWPGGSSGLEAQLELLHWALYHNLVA